MSLQWAKNMVGIKLSEEEMSKIPYPRLELTVHVSTKFVELLGVASTLVLGPLAAALRKKNRNIAGIVSVSSRVGTRGVILGLVLGPLATWAKLYKAEGIEPFYDRCYRLRHNHNQLRVDRGAYAGALSGAVLFPLALKSCPIYGSLFGLSVGTLGAGLYNNLK